MANANDGPVGLGGWLIIPIIGLIYLPIRLAISVKSDYLPIFQEGYWEVLTTPGSEAYHHLWGPYIIFEIVVNAVFLVACLYLLFLMFTKSYKLPKLIIIFYCANLIFVVADYFMGNMIPAVATQINDKEVIKEVIRSVLGVLIWVPYFLVSKRVKNTFVKLNQEVKPLG